MRIALLSLVLSLTAIDLYAQAPVPADTFAIDWSMNLLGLRVGHKLPTGATFVANCPPGGTVTGTIWGTDTYTSDSPICVAAAHAGALTATSGGAVIVEAAPGLQEYVGSIRNGVTSSSYPSWDASYRFPAAPRVAETGDPNVTRFQGNWTTSPRSVGAKTGGRVRFECAAGESGGSVWGTDVYTDDSSMCEAAVHAGVITRSKGGVVYLEILGAQPSYRGSTRNGVSTHDYPAWPGSFRFVAND